MSNPGHISNPYFTTHRADIVNSVAGFMYAGNQLLFTGLSANVKDKDRVKRRDMLAGKDNGEVGEYLDGEFSNNPVEIADGLADVAVIAIGTLFKYFGVDLGMAIIAEVCRSNNDKVNGKHGPTVFSEDGLKVLKPEGWVGPQIEKLLREHDFQFMPSDSMFVPFDQVEVESDGGE